MCQHVPACPAGHAPDCTAARVVADHRGPGWSLLCNGAVLFEDRGALLAGGRPPGRRGPARAVRPGHTIAGIPASRNARRPHVL
ncbi:MAG TPA: DUF5999 family protein [Streptosporangiaceae bacterium]